MKDKKDPKLYREQDEKLIIFGSRDSVIPESLLFNSEDNLSEDARVWALIKKYAMRGNDMPTQNEIAEILSKSRPTINSSIQMLRVNRWITIFQEEDRNSKGQFRRLVYAVHSYQMPIETTLSYDPGYIDFLQEKAQGSLERIRKRALQILSDSKPFLSNNKRQLIISHDEKQNTVVIDSLPSKFFLHGKHPSTTSNNIYSKTTSSSGEVLNNFTSPTGNVSIGSSTLSAGKESIERYLSRLPNSVIDQLFNSIKKNQLKPEQVISVLRVAVNRYEDAAIPPIKHLPSYLDSLCRKSAKGQLYDSDLERQSTNQKRIKQAENNINKALQVRASVVGIQRHPDESKEAFEKRVNDAEYIRQMQRLGGSNG